MKSILFYFVASFVAFPCFAVSNDILAGLEATGELKVEKGFPGCPDDRVPLRSSNSTVICVERLELPSGVQSELWLMAGEQYDNNFGEFDFRITKMEILSKISPPADLSDDMLFINGLASMFGIPSSSLDVDSIEIYNSVSEGGFLNLPNVLSMGGILEEFHFTDTGRFVEDLVKQWQGQHLVLVKAVALDEFTTVYVEYNFFVTKNTILYFKAVMFPS